MSAESSDKRTDKLHAAALHAAGISSRTLWIGLVAILFGDFSILLWVSVCHYSDHPELLRSFDLKTAEDTTIFGQSDLAL